MISEKQMYALVALCAAVWAICLWKEGTPASASLLHPFDTVVFLLLTAVTIFNKWAWKWRWLHPWFVDQPVLIGTWRGKLESSWINPDTNVGIPPIDAFIVVRQTYSKIRVKLITQESSSDLIQGNLTQDGDDVYMITGVYVNIPKVKHLDRSPMHFGAIHLKVNGEHADAMRGHYWTNRKTRGDMYFDERSRKICYDFVEAERLFADAGNNGRDST